MEGRRGGRKEARSAPSIWFRSAGLMGAATIFTPTWSAVGGSTFKALRLLVFHTLSSTHNTYARTSEDGTHKRTFSGSPCSLYSSCCTWMESWRTCERAARILRTAIMAACERKERGEEMRVVRNVSVGGVCTQSGLTSCRNLCRNPCSWRLPVRFQVPAVLFGDTFPLVFRCGAPL